MAAWNHLGRFALAAAVAGCAAASPSPQREPARAFGAAPAEPGVTTAEPSPPPSPAIDVSELASATAEEPGDAADARAHIVIMQVGLNGQYVDPDLRDAISRRLGRHPLLTTDASGARSRCLPSLMLDLTATLDRSSGQFVDIDLRWLVSNSHGRMVGLIEQRARLEAHRRDTDATLWQLGLDSILEATPSKLLALRGAEPAAACTVAVHLGR